MNSTVTSQEPGPAADVYRLPIGGLLKQSLNDYPGRVSAVMFTRGCNFRCVYCHNPELVLPDRLVDSRPLANEAVFAWLSLNRGLLDAVVITGGEPTLHSGLPDCIRRIKSLGLEVKLDTNGTHPEMLGTLIREGLVDYIAMDLKSVPDYRKYAALCGGLVTERTIEAILQSLVLLHESGVRCEVRTTLLGSHHTGNDVARLVRMVHVPYFLQECNPEKTLRNVAKKGFTGKEFEKLIESLEQKRGNVCLR